MNQNIKKFDLEEGRELSFEYGRLAKQADGSVVVRMGDTMVLCTVVSAKSRNKDQDFFPLSVEYREQFAAAGRFPGGFFKREGKPSEKAILSARLIDRTLRPLFPNDYMNETQVICTVISSDGENDADVLAGVAASMALQLSDIPFLGPIGMVRVAQINGKYVVNPTLSQLKESDMNIVVSGTKTDIMMLEGGMNEIPEEGLLEAIKYAHKYIERLCSFQKQETESVAKPKREVEVIEIDDNISQIVKDTVTESLKKLIQEGLSTSEYREKKQSLKDNIKVAVEKSNLEYDAFKKDIENVFKSIEKELLREMILKDKRRMDGRNPEDIRPIWCEVGYMPRTHGSAIFTRGETQSMVSITLGTKKNEQIIDTLLVDGRKQFMLHYNFPPFCVGEAAPMRGTSRREIGHGHLAEQAIQYVMPKFEDFSYVVRIISDILESNGSSSMATVCGGTLALMDAGVPITNPVAGIAMGMVVGEKETVILSDILGNEDFLGDMDFKTAGTKNGITACQMDIKVQGISFDTLEKALKQAHKGRLSILGTMLQTISKSRDEISRYVPKYKVMKIESEKIGALIGPGGKNIQRIQKDTNTEVSVDDDTEQGVGLVSISGLDTEQIKAAIQQVNYSIGNFKEGSVFEGTVKSIKEFGAFVEFVPSKEGLLHISEINNKRIKDINKVLKVGQSIKVKLMKIERNGRYRLSHKALNNE